ncbi:von Willebrand factor D and EGF domain-containing protein-like [Mercenaria mercenaria]|uniref:von Willebrand factor D and EGF domain-containing protein-like n=1 Tax=Mercenaria mercenaria TaxID=6596 RepID=UPI00234F0FF0|nr:von Willebrand factor D and EGF domain-containing protein-like [Mercenaria mercenaria]
MVNTDIMCKSIFVLLATCLTFGSFVISAETVLNTNGDPCESAQILHFLKERVVGYNLSIGEPPICDHYFYPGWYQMYDFVIASTENGCGTYYNWYRKGELPTNEEIENVTYCLNAGNGDCSLTVEGQVKKCSDKYVFNLPAVNGCPQAYCIESLNGTNVGNNDKADISSVQPTVEAEVVRMGDGHNELHFYCDFSPPNDTDYFYTVAWGITTGFSWTDSLLETQPTKYLEKDSFNSNHALTETTLRVKKYGRLGITIACIINAMTGPTTQSHPSQASSPKFCGIEIVDKEEIRLNDTNSENVFLRLTVPFGCHASETRGCSLDVILYIPQNNEDNCKPTSLSQRETVERAKNRCGVRINNNEINVLKNISVSGLSGQNRENVMWPFTLVLATQEYFPAHPIFQNYFLDPVKVDVASNMTRLTGKVCYSHNDPHMQSFDQKTYENQNEGVFLLYRNTEHNVQVQMKTSRCHKDNDKIWCNCGVAVNAGRDVFILSSCENGEILSPKFRCQDAILARSVKVDTSSGRRFQVYLPTGTEVRISVQENAFFKPFINIDITPSLEDWENTIGLCGNFNGDDTDDRNKRANSTEQDTNLSWIVPPKENLFDSKNDARLVKWSAEKWFCQCEAKLQGSSPENAVRCTADTAKKCREDTYETSYKDRCSIARKKRNAHGRYVDRGLDLHHSTKTSFVSKYDEGIETSNAITKRSEYDHVTARTDCVRMLNTTAFQMCSEVPKFDTDGFINDCALDAMATQSMEWSSSHLDALKDICVFEVNVNQPLTVEDLASFEPTDNSSSSINITTDIMSITKQLSPDSVFNAEFLNELKNVSCLNDCSRHGECNEGSCQCEVGFIGADCSIDSSKPPIMRGIPDNGECDLQYRECAKTSVFGRNFVSLPNLTCLLIPFEVTAGMKIMEGDPFIRKAKLETFIEVSCPLSIPPLKRSIKEEPQGFIARGFRISVSNDGREYSENDAIVIFDSKCVNCSKVGGKIYCKKKSGYCIESGQCYEYQDMFGCYLCLGATNNSLDWTPGPDCSGGIATLETTDAPTPETQSVAPPAQSKSWIIAAAVTPVACLIILVSLIYWVYRRKKTRRKVAVTYSERHKQRNTELAASVSNKTLQMEQIKN